MIWYKLSILQKLSPKKKKDILQTYDLMLHDFVQSHPIHQSHSQYCSKKKIFSFTVLPGPAQGPLQNALPILYKRITVLGLQKKFCLL